MNENLDMAERCAQISKTADDEIVRSIFARMSQLYHQLHEQRGEACKLEEAAGSFFNI